MNKRKGNKLLTDTANPNGSRDQKELNLKFCYSLVHCHCIEKTL